MLVIYLTNKNNFLCTLSIFFLLTFFIAGASVASPLNENLYVDDDVVYSKELSSLPIDKPTGFHLISHGRPGELLLNGKWIDGQELAVLINTFLTGQEELFIYGCEFGKGEKGRNAVKNLEKSLGLKVFASDDITGKDGDWDLEVGTGYTPIVIPDYSYNLQICDDPFQPKFMSGFHSTIAVTDNGMEIWGQYAGSGITGQPSNILSPVEITPANGFNYTGDLLMATLADHRESPQYAILTTTGLFVWGQTNRLVSTNLKSGRDFESVAMPVGVSPSDIKMIRGTDKVFVLLLNNGNLWITHIGRDAAAGQGGPVDNGIWSEVAGLTIDNVIASSATVFAVTATGEYYTWGNSAFLGDGSAEAELNVPTLMTAPFAGAPSQIAMTANDEHSTYYVLNPNNNKMYCLGDNGEGQLGVGDIVDRTSWDIVQNEDGTGDLEDVVFINAYESGNGSDGNSGRCASAVTADRAIYLWGNNRRFMISSSVVDNGRAMLPTKPNYYYGNASYIENGGHTSLFYDRSVNKYCYVGHAVDGSIGNGQGGDNEIQTFDCFITADYEACDKCDYTDPALDCDEDGVNNDTDCSPLDSDQSSGCFGCGINSVAEKGNNILSGTSRIIIADDGLYAVGRNMHPDGETSLDTPLKISQENGYIYSGTPKVAAIGGSQQSQAILLTTQGLYAWGEPVEVLNNTVGPTNQPNFHPISMPDGLDAGDVVALEVASGIIALLSSSGEVFTMRDGATSSLLGDDGVGERGVWYQATISGVQLLSVSNGCMFAYTGSQLFTWGEDIYLGDGTGTSDADLPSQMTAPPSGARIKKIVVTSESGAGRNTYYVLYDNGELYTLGESGQGQTGQGSTGDLTSWALVRNADNSGPLADVVDVSGSSSCNRGATLGAVTSSGDVYLWGENINESISSGANNPQNLPRIPDGFTSGTDKAVSAAVGDLTTVITLEDGTNLFLGNNEYGTKGDGTTQSDDIGTLEATTFPNIVVCPNELFPDPPGTTSQNDINQTPQDVNVSGNLFTNDIDPHGDEISISSAMIDTDGDGVPDAPFTADGSPQTIAGVGTLSIDPATGEYTFDPEPDFTGQVPILSYTITDATGEMDTSTLDIDVFPSPDGSDLGPLANDDTNTTDQNTPVQSNLIDGNDSDPDTPQDDLTVTAVTALDAMGNEISITPGSMTPTDIYDEDGVLAGTITVDVDGSYVYSPTADYVGDVPVQYTISDPEGNEDSATLEITVVEDSAGVDNNTYANDDATSGPVNVPQMTNLLSNDNDPESDDQDVESITVDSDGDGLLETIAITNASPIDIYLDQDGDGTPELVGTVSINSESGDITFDPEPDFIGTAPIVYTAVDEFGNIDIATYYPTTLPNESGETVAENDINQTPQDVTVSGNLFTNDIDPQGDEISISEAMIDTDGDGIPDAPFTVDGSPQTIAGVGTLSVDPSTGEYTFDPEPDFTGQVPILSYEITDATGAMDAATLDIDVIPTPDGSDLGPVANDDTNTTDQNTPVQGNLIDGNDNDPDTPQDDLVITEVTALDDMGMEISITPGDPTPTPIYDEDGNLAGTIVVDEDGSYTFDPETDYVGDVPVEYTVADPEGNEDSATLEIAVVEDPTGNDNNTYGNDDASVGPQDDPQMVNLLGNDNDPEGDDQEIASIIIDSDGDGMLETITPLAGTPQDVYQDQDGDGTPELVGTVEVNPETGDVIFDPEPDFIGTAPIIYEVEDSEGNTDIATYYATTLPETETIAENDINQTPQDVTVSGNLFTNDIDPQGDEISISEAMIDTDGDGVPDASFTADGSPQTIAGVGTLSVDPSTGEYTFDPEPDFTGQVPILSYEITDATGAMDAATLDIDVIPTPDGSDLGPVANDDTNTTDQNTPVQGNLIDGNDNDPDTPQDDLVITEVTALDDMGMEISVTPGDPTPTPIYDEDGNLAGTIVVDEDGSYTFDPETDYVGDVPVEYTVADPEGNEDSATLEIAVVEDPTGNDNNTYGNDDASVGPQDDPQMVNLLGNDNDPEGDDQEIASIIIDSDGDGMLETITPLAGTPQDVYQDQDGDGTPELVGTVEVNPETGDVIFDPEPDFIGTAPIIYEVEDSEGNTDIATYYATTLPETETIAENDINQTPQDVTVSGNLFTNDIDPQGDEISISEAMIDTDGDGVPDASFTADGSPQTITGVGTLSVDPSTGEYTFDPEPDFTGQVPILSYEITDATGAMDAATLDIDVIPTPDGSDLGPVANDDTNTTDQNTPVQGNLIDGNDNDPDTPQDDLVITEVTALDDMGMEISITPGDPTPTPIYDEDGNLAGTIVVDEDGSYTFDPETDYVGDVPVEYTVADPEGNEDSATLEITVVEDPTGDDNNTYGNDDASVGPQDDPQMVNLLGNDNDPEGDDQDIASIIIDSDGDGMLETITPLAGTPQDVYQDQDGDGTPELVGTIEVNPQTGDVTFDPEPDFIGTAPIIYEVEDSEGNTDVATYYATTLPETETIAENDINQTPQDVTVSGNLFTNDIDPQGDEISISEAMIDTDGDGIPDAPFTADGSPQTIAGVGTLSVDPSTGEYTFDPEPDFTGQVPILSYEITDATGAMDAATLDIDVIPTPDESDLGPVANDDTNTTDQNTPVQGNLIDGNDNDPDTPQDDLVITEVTALDDMGMEISVTPGDPTPTPIYDEDGNLAGTIVVDEDGSYTFDPETDYVGDVPVEYTVADPEGNEDSATLEIAVVEDPTGNDNNTYANDDATVGLSDEPQMTNLLGNDNDPELDDQDVSSLLIDTDGDGMLDIVTPVAGTPQDVYQDQDGDGTPELVGTVEVNPETGDVIFDPEPDFIGTAPIIYEVEDSEGNTDIATYYATTLPEVIAENDINQTPQGVAVDGNLFTNDIDPQGQNFTVTDAMIDTDGDGVPDTPFNTDGSPQTIAGVGTLSVDPSTGEYTFDPEPDFTGQVPIIEYTITNESGATDSATLDIDVFPNSDPTTDLGPVANDDTNSTYPDVSVSASVLSPNDSDPDTPTDELMVTEITALDMNGNVFALVPGSSFTADIYDENGELAGSFLMDEEGNYTFFPESDFEGEVPVNYTIEDPEGNSDMAVLTITVLDGIGPVNLTFTNDDASSGLQDENQSGNILDNDHDPESDTQGVNSIDTDGDGIPDSTPSGSPQNIEQNGELIGTLSIDPVTGDYIWDPEADFVGTAVVPYVACDDNAMVSCDTATLYLTTIGTFRDFGDLPSLYGEIFAIGSNDADEDNVPDADGSVWLGTEITYENTQPYSDLADGDSDDGLAIIEIAPPTGTGRTGLWRVTLNSNTAGQTVYFKLNLDWDLDGTFEDSYTGSGVTMSPVDVDVTINVPDGWTDGDIVNVRLVAGTSSDDVNITSGSLSNGEIEDYQYQSTQVLPVELLNFNVEKEGNAALLTWSTASELNNDFFDVERSLDGNNFHTIGSVDGAGTSTTVQNYDFIDNNLLSGTYYYRLKQVDFDGSESYSRIVSIDLESTLDISIFPNPVAETLFVSGNIEAAQSIVVRDASGKEVYSNTWNNQQSINMSNLNAGIYFINLTDEKGNNVYSNKIVKF